MRAAAAALLAAVLVLGLAACTGKDAVADSGTGAYRFSGATAKGQVIAVADRKAIGEVDTTLLDGAKFDFSTLAGKVALVNFYASWCVPCQTETPQLGDLYRDMQSTGVQFVGVATKESSSATAREFVKDMDVTYPVVYDQQAKVALQMGHIPVIALPMTVILDKEHRVAAVYTTQVLPADLRPTLNTLLAES